MRRLAIYDRVSFLHGMGLSTTKESSLKAADMKGEVRVSHRCDKTSLDSITDTAKKRNTLPSELTDLRATRVRDRTGMAEPEMQVELCVQPVRSRSRESITTSGRRFSIENRNPC